MDKRQEELNNLYEEAYRLQRSTGMPHRVEGNSRIGLYVVPDYSKMAKTCFDYDAYPRESKTQHLKAEKIKAQKADDLEKMLTKGNIYLTCLGSNIVLIIIVMLAAKLAGLY